MGTEPDNQKNRKHKSFAGAIIIALGIIMIIGGIYPYLSNKNQTPEPIANIESTDETPPTAQKQVDTATVIEEKSVTVPQTEPKVIAESAPEIEESSKLPSLDDSDAIALASAQQLSSIPGYSLLLNKQEIIRNFVVFIDNFSRGELVANFSPLGKPSEPFTIIKAEKKMLLNPESYNRYNLYAEIVNSINIESAISQYHALQPLLDQAYQEIAYPDGAFHHVIIDAIDIVLSAPIVREPIELIAPSAMYKYADPELEALPDAQKLLLRMGPDNILKLKTKLQQIQSALQEL